MSVDSRKQEIGDVDQIPIDWEVVTWTIPNVSSILFAVDYGFQSPSFSFAGASWILEIYFNGQTDFNSKGYIDVAIQRLHSEIQEHDFLSKIYCKNVFDKEFKPINKRFIFHPKHTKAHALKIMKNFEESLDKWEIVPNDTFTLVCEFQNKKTTVQTKSEKQAAGGEKFRVSGKPEVGEIEKSSFQLTGIKWTIRNTSSLPSPADYQIQSPPFSFANASWTLKIYPYFQMQDAGKRYFYVALERVHSEIPAHYVFVNICFEDCKKALDEVSRAYIFDSNHKLGDVIYFTLREEQLKAPHDTITLFCKFGIEKKAENGLDSQANLVEPGDDSKAGSSVDFLKYKVLNDFKELFIKQEDCDVVIRVKQQEFSAHRVILKARSPVFDSTFRYDMKEKASGVVDIADCDPDTFSDFLRFLYCGEIEKLSSENVFSLFTTADKYEVLDLRLKCLEFIKRNLTVDTFCDTIALALQHSEAELIKSCTDFFTKNLQKIIVTVKWQLFSAQNPTHSNELFIKALVPV